MGFEAALSEWRFSINHVMTLRSAAGILAQAFAKREAEARLAYQAGHDPLTGLPNRWSFLEALRAGVDQLARDGDAADVTGADGVGLAVLLFDLDRFKVVNDSLGHRLGDQLLVILAQRMDDGSPGGHGAGPDGRRRAGRHGEGPRRGRAEAAAVAEELREVVRRPVMVEGHEMSTTASAGIAFTALPDRERRRPAASRRCGAVRGQGVRSGPHRGLRRDPAGQGAPSAPERDRAAPGLGPRSSWWCTTSPRWRCRRVA